MGERNQTSWTEFILVGFSDVPHLRILLFVCFLMIYLVTVAGNILVMVAVYSDSRLHTPMYFFLTNLSFVDICYISITFPRMLANFFLQGAHITLLECLMQVHFYIGLIIIEFFLLTIMAYDRYTAICNPLRYTDIMSNSVCAYMVSGAWLLGLLAPTTHTTLISKVYFCESNKLNHFFCDLVALLHLVCSTTASIDSMTYFLSVTIPITSFILIITSYANIISAVLKIQSTAGKQKAFSTCASHLTAVILFCGLLLFNDMRPASMYSENQSRISALVYVAVSPMCNPIIYTLKNKEFKDTLQRLRNAS